MGRGLPLCGDSALVWTKTARATNHANERMCFDLLLWCNRHSRPDALQSINDNFFGTLQTGANDAFTLHFRPEVYCLVGDCVRAREGEHELLRLVRANCALFHQQRWMTLTQRHPYSRKQSRNNPPVGIRKYSAQKDAAGIRIETVIKRFDIAAMRKARFVSELQFHRNPA